MTLLCGEQSLRWVSRIYLSSDVRCMGDVRKGGGGGGGYLFMKEVGGVEGWCIVCIREPEYEKIYV